jgi:transposase
MRQWTDIRQRVLCDGVSKRQILRETGMHRATLEKILSQGDPPGYRCSKLRSKPKVGPYVDRIQQILDADAHSPRKQRHTAQRIYERLLEEGYAGKYTVIKDTVRELRQTMREVYVPLAHQPGEAQMDYFEASVVLAGVQRKVHGFVMALPYSDAFFVACFERSVRRAFGKVTFVLSTTLAAFRGASATTTAGSRLRRSSGCMSGH